MLGRNLASGDAVGIRFPPPGLPLWGQLTVGLRELWQPTANGNTEAAWPWLAGEGGGSSRECTETCPVGSSEMCVVMV